MDERFLHYIWKFQKFKKGPLSLTDGRPLTVFHQGNHNHNSGPDFEEAQIQIDGLKWAGSVEIHKKSSDWYAHQHEKNPAYGNTILHVVWENNTNVFIDNQAIPTLELSSFVDEKTICDYQKFLDSASTIPCEKQIHQISDLHFINTLDRMLAERLHQKAEAILGSLSKSKGDWEQTCYMSLAEVFGFSVNKPAFKALAESLPFGVVKKCQQSLHQLEAIVFGQAGLLDQSIDDKYFRSLKEEYTFLRSKHDLKKRLSLVNWKFSRMRPANFPARRLAQFASICSTNHMFSSLIELGDRADFRKIFSTETSAYWENHYDFKKDSKGKYLRLGNSTIDILIINWVAPTLAAYGKHLNDQQHIDQAIRLLESTPPENNQIMRVWKELGKESRNAFDSQAMIGLFKNYCSLKKCLQCPVGQEIMNK